MLDETPLPSPFTDRSGALFYVDILTDPLVSSLIC